MTKNIYTYVGKGESSPELINFCGKQEFLRGEAVEVTDSALIAKLEKHPCFVKGEVSRTALAEKDREAIDTANKSRSRNNKLQAAESQRNK